jgi:uncharacterized protein (TIGR02001 family)
MKLNKLHLATLTALGISTMGIALPAQAALTGSIGVSNMYLWRGTNQTGGGGQVWGELKYTHDSGAFASVWTSPDSLDGHETDVYFGYNGKVQDFGFGVAFWEIMYNEAVVADADTGDLSADLADNDVQELQLTASYGPVAFNLYYGLAAPISVDEENDEWLYYTLSGTFDKYTVLFGKWDLENEDADSYSHLTFTYAATPELAFGVNFTFSSEDIPDTAVDNPRAGLSATEEGPLVFASYTWTFDLSKK